MDGVRGRLRGRPDVGPVGARDGEPDPVSPRKLPGGGVDLQLELVYLSRRQRLGVGEGAAPRRVQHPLGDEVRGAVGSDVGQARCESDHRGGRGHVQERRGATDDVHVLVERRRAVDERERLVGALVGRQPELEAARPEAAHHADGRYVLEVVGSLGARSRCRVNRRRRGEGSARRRRAVASRAPRAIRLPPRGGRRPASRGAARRRRREARP